MMSVGFIAFVTVLHIIGKVRQFLGGRLGRQKGKKKTRDLDFGEDDDGAEGASAHFPLSSCY